MKEQVKRTFNKSQDFTKSTFDTVSTIVTKTTTSVDGYIAPVRKSVLERFPVLFSLLVTFGVTTTFLGFEKIIAQIDVLDRNPFLVLILGMGILASTGTLYKKLK